MSTDVLIRRAARVQARARIDDPIDAILDDVFVLWRAFEGSLDKSWSRTLRQPVIQAVSATLSYASPRSVPRLRDLLEALRRMPDGSDLELETWFPSSVADHRPRSAWEADVAELAGLDSSASRWPHKAVRALADVLYDLRSAVFHASALTSHRLTIHLAPALRAFWLDFLAIRGAELACEPPAAFRERIEAEARRLATTAGRR